MPYLPSRLAECMIEVVCSYDVIVRNIQSCACQRSNDDPQGRVSRIKLVVIESISTIHQICSPSIDILLQRLVIKGRDRSFLLKCSIVIGLRLNRVLDLVPRVMHAVLCSKVPFHSGKSCIQLRNRYTGQIRPLVLQSMDKGVKVGRWRAIVAAESVSQIPSTV